MVSILEAVTAVLPALNLEELKGLYYAATNEIIARIHFMEVNTLTREEIKMLVVGDVIPAIKSVRDRTGFGLKESKDIVDSFRPTEMENGEKRFVCSQVRR